jgi:hypothetical protein
MSKKVDYVADKMVARPYIIEMGAGRVSNWFHCSREDIIEARAIARKILNDLGECGGEKFVAQYIPTKKIPKILILDIETAPIKAYVWGIWKQDVRLDAIISDWFILSWSAKWLYDARVMSDRLSGEEALKENDKRLVCGLWNVLDQADIVIAHNGNSFDVPKINSRFLRWGLAPTSPYQQIDTLLIARKQFAFTSNKLDELAKVFGMEGKIKTNFQLWVDCLAGSNEALEQMEIYNRQDVVVLEEVYLKLRPWIKAHVNLGLYMEGDSQICPNCGSHNIYADGNYYYTPAGRYKTYRCECGAISRDRHSDLTKDEKTNLVISVAR